MKIKNNHKTNIDFFKKCFARSVKANYSTGFTLIELLVVIAIIAMLSSIVLASLNSARNKGADASIKSNMNNIRSQAEIIFDSVSPNKYVTMCSNVVISKMLTAIQNSSGIAAVCQANNLSDSLAAYAVQSTLKGGGYWCVDSTGVAKADVTALGALYACPSP
jgi:prepilin-type N-terminal cleavage/methylation domain-containing protein